MLNFAIFHRAIEGTSHSLKKFPMHQHLMNTYDAHLRGMAIHPFFVLLLQIGGNPADETALLFPILVKVEYLHYDIIELVRAIRARAFIHQQFCSQFEIA